MNIICATLAAAGLLMAQKLSSPSDLGPNLPARPIGPSDLLSIIVYGAPELSRAVRVSEDGSVRLPMLLAPLPVQGMMPAELETRLSDALVAEHILVDPVVTVNIAQYATRPISVAGAVKRPLTFEVHEPVTLLDALARAEGLSAEAGTEVLVTRAAKDGVRAVERILVRDLMETSTPSANLVLAGGEEVRIPEAGRVFVVGNVRKPGSFRVSTTVAMTVLQALALSEGLAPFSTKTAFVYREQDGGGKKEIEVELRKIMDRKSPDVSLAAGDIFYIPDNRRGRVTSTAIERALSFAAGTASGALILGVNR